MATFNIQGKVLKKSAPLGLSYAKVQAFHLGSSAPLVETQTEIDGSFDVSFPWTETGRPDVHFRVTQVINGSEQVIYNENPATQTRRNIADVLAVTLRTDAGLAASPPLSGRPYDRLFVFTRVGNIGVDRIDAASGYADSDVLPAAPNSAHANAPFGSTLDIAGWFGEFAGVYRYKVQYTDATVLDASTVWTDVDDPLANSYLEFGLGTANWITMPMGPFEEGGQTNVYKLPYVERPGQPWIFPDRIAQWDTSKVANNLYTLRIQGFAVGTDGATLVPSAALILGAGSQLKLRIDNSAPVVRILGIEHAPTPGDFAVVEVCDIVPFGTDRLRLQIEARDAEGHLGAYGLAALFGHSESVNPPPPGAAGSYAGHIDASRKWHGGTFTVEYDGATYSATQMRTCAYQFRLNAAKRTTNGYTTLFAGEDTVHITLQRP